MNAPQSESQADTTAMERLRAGDDLALNEIMERWTPRVSAFLFRFLGNAADARDLTQETFVAVYASRFRYRPSTPFSSWLFGIASNLARQRLRWRSRHPEVAIEMATEQPAMAGVDQIVQETPATLIEATERADAVRRAIASLPWAMREVVLLAEYENLPQSEIAKIAGCSVKAVEMRLYRARTELRKALAGLLENP